MPHHPSSCHAGKQHGANSAMRSHLGLSTPGTRCAKFGTCALMKRMINCCDSSLSSNRQQLQPPNWRERTAMVPKQGSRANLPALYLSYVNSYCNSNSLWHGGVIFGALRPTWRGATYLKACYSIVQFVVELSAEVSFGRYLQKAKHLQ